MDNFEYFFHKFCVKNSKLTHPHKLIPFYKKNVDRDRKRILIACMPKSGSTFMTQLLRHHLRLPLHHLTLDYGKGEQEVCWTKLDAVVTSDALFIQQHVRASQNTLKVIRLFNIQTIVMIRNLLDAVVSFREHILKESVDSTMFHFDPAFLQWEERRQYEFIIDLVLPWYLNFLGTWIDANKHKDISLLWLNYSDWIDDPKATLKQIDAFCDRTHSPEAASQAVARAKNEFIRFNVGKSGRGRKLLDGDLQAKVRHLLSYYPSCAPYRESLV
jgi:hypothetical protein